MTRQEVFDKVASHLLKQGKRSEILDAEGSASCLYRGPDGLTCAVGCLIKDEFYCPSLEGNSVALDIVNKAVKDSTGFDTEKEANINLLIALQNLHDCVAPTSWKRKLREFANFRQLEWNIKD